MTHIYLVSIGETYNEFYHRKYHVLSNPYHKGCLLNFQVKIFPWLSTLSDHATPRLNGLDLYTYPYPSLLGDMREWVDVPTDDHVARGITDHMNETYQIYPCDHDRLHLENQSVSVASVEPSNSREQNHVIYHNNHSYSSDQANNLTRAVSNGHDSHEHVNDLSESSSAAQTGPSRVHSAGSTPPLQPAGSVLTEHTSAALSGSSFTPAISSRQSSLPSRIAGSDNRNRGPRPDLEQAISRNPTGNRGDRGEATRTDSQAMEVDDRDDDISYGNNDVENHDQRSVLLPRTRREQRRRRMRDYGSM